MSSALPVLPSPSTRTLWSRHSGATRARCRRRPSRGRRRRRSRPGRPCDVVAGAGCRDGALEPAHERMVAVDAAVEDADVDAGPGRASERPIPRRSGRATRRGSRWTPRRPSVRLQAGSNRSPHSVPECPGPGRRQPPPASAAGLFRMTVAPDGGEIDIDEMGGRPGGRLRERPPQRSRRPRSWVEPSTEASAASPATSAAASAMRSGTSAAWRSATPRAKSRCSREPVGSRRTASTSPNAAASSSPRRVRRERSARA